MNMPDSEPFACLRELSLVLCIPLRIERYEWLGLFATSLGGFCSTPIERESGLHQSRTCRVSDHLCIVLLL